jgi:hypothetical protein
VVPAKFGQQHASQGVVCGVCVAEVAVVRVLYVAEVPVAAAAAGSMSGAVAAEMTGRMTSGTFF